MRRECRKRCIGGTKRKKEKRKKRERETKEERKEKENERCAVGRARPSQTERYISILSLYFELERWG